MFSIEIPEFIVFLLALCVPLFIAIRIDKKNIRPRGQKILTVFAYFWFCVIFLVMVANIIQAYRFNSFDLYIFLGLLLFTAPGFMALVLRGWLEQRGKRTSDNDSGEKK